MTEIYIDEEGYEVDDYTIEDEEQWAKDWETVIIEIGYDKVLNTENEDHWNMPIWINGLTDDDLPF